MSGSRPETVSSTGGSSVMRTHGTPDVATIDDQLQAPQDWQIRTRPSWDEERCVTRPGRKRPGTRETHEADHDCRNRRQALIARILLLCYCLIDDHSTRHLLRPDVPYCNPDVSQMPRRAKD